MSKHLPEHLGDGLAYEDWLPVKWSVAKKSVPLAVQAHIHDANEKFLRRVSTLEEEPVSVAETHPELAKELMRLESKVDMVLDMVGTVLAGHLKLPKPTPIRLTAEGITWESPKAPVVKSHVTIALYMLPNYPYPLTLQGVVTSVAKCTGGRRITVTFDAMSEAAQEWLEKTIFRQHRRKIALSRRAQPSHDG